MLIVFQSKGAATFEMLHEHGAPLLELMGYGDRKEGAISGPALLDAISNLESGLGRQSGAHESPDDENQQVGMSARAYPLMEMLKHAVKNESYLMWHRD